MQPDLIEWGGKRSLFGAQLASVGDGESRFLYSPHESGFDHAGSVTGVIGMLLDFATEAAVRTRLPAGVGFYVIETNIRFLRAVRAETEEIEAHGEVLRVGSKVAYAQAHARTEDGELVAHATSSLSLAR